MNMNTKFSIHLKSPYHHHLHSQMQLSCLMPTCKSMNCSIPVKGMVGEGGKTPIQEKQKQVNFLKGLAPPLIAAVVALSPICDTPESVCCNEPGSKLMVCLQNLSGRSLKCQCRLDILFGTKVGEGHRKGLTVCYSHGYNPDEASLAQATDIQRGATLFGRACIGCHDAGGNILQPGATLFFKDLQRNGVDTEEEIYRITYYGKGRMPGFGENCTPRGQCTFGPRLQEEEIKLLAEFVKLQADQGWPNLEISGD